MNSLTARFAFHLISQPAFIECGAPVLLYSVAQASGLVRVFINDQEVGETPPLVVSSKIKHSASNLGPLEKSREAVILHLYFLAM